MSVLADSVTFIIYQAKCMLWQNFSLLYANNFGSYGPAK